MCVWVEDADKLEINSKELDIIFENKIISAYLNGKSSLGLAGIKGQGKTFLIKVKRKKVGQDQSVLCLPKNAMLDVLDSALVIDKSLNNYLIDYSVWVNIWKFAICGTIIQYPQFSDLFTALQIRKSTRNLLKLKNVNYTPTFLLEKLLRLNVKDLIEILMDTEELMGAVREIHQSIYIFFDKLDQGFSGYAKMFDADCRLPKRSRNASFWQYAQYSLAEASYDIFAKTANHIKVLYTIRQEALIDAERINKDKARNINAYILSLKYSKSDLQKMYKLYIENEDDKNLADAACKRTYPSRAFLGLEELEHGYIPETTENIFDYLYRHSFKRPYDIMKICRELYFTQDLNVKEIRHIVNKEANELLSMYLHELEIFIPCDVADLESLIKMLPGNILNSELMKDICDTFNIENNPSESWQCNQSCAGYYNFQPFSILYNLGLIGYLKKHEADEYPREEFINIGNSILELNSHTLPDSKLYFLHPALSNKARDMRNSMGLTFQMNKVLLVGDGCEVKKEQGSKAQYFARKCHKCFLKERIFISSTIFDLEEEREQIREYIKARGLHPIMSEHNDFDLNNSLKVHSHDCCIEEMLKCNSVIFIIGKQYGGLYKGENYKKQRDEIQHLSKGKIKDPSISLMEYYVARTNKRKCYVYVHSNIDNPDYRSTLSEDIQNEIKFLTHFSVDGKTIVGNWMSRYSSIDDLILSLKNVKFN
jgi:hypothetical protein